MEPEDNPDVDNPKPGVELQKSLVGTNAEGTAAPDSFFKVNAADCCSNDVVIASGTYGTEDNVKPTPLLKLEEKDVRAGFEKPLAEVATIPNGPSGAGDPLGTYNYDIPVSRIHPASVPLYPEGGSGVQGKDFKGYGNYSNNADVWDGWGQFQTLQNPSDAKGASFLNVRLAQNEPPIEEDRRFAVTIACDDNVTPVVEPGDATNPDGSVRYNIAYLGYNFYYTEQKNGQLGQPIMGGTVLNLDPKTTPANDPAWTKEPKVTFDYNFRRPGFYVVEITAIDRSANKRVMRVPVQIARLSSSFKAIDVEGRRQ
jgi:hypothetical protein